MSEISTEAAAQAPSNSEGNSPAASAPENSQAAAANGGAANPNTQTDGAQPQNGESTRTVESLLESGSLKDLQAALRNPESLREDTGTQGEEDSRRGAEAQRGEDAGTERCNAPG